MNLPLRVLYYGKDEPPPEQTALRAGPLSLVFEAGDLRYIRLGDREILRRVYAAVRDRNWGTVPPTMSNLRMEDGGDSFRVTYDVTHRQGEIDFFWRGTIAGDAEGTVTFTMAGEARSTFLRNRIGFCVLHPIRECASTRCRVEKVDGTVEEGVFPRLISPHQPFFDIRAISHEVASSLWAEVRFAGDTFEMEDQRNWTDGSYKTYCTPLRLGYPVEVKAGTRVEQSVTVICRGGSQAHRSKRDTGVTVSVDNSPLGPLPRIGLGSASHGRALTEREVSRLRALNLSHLRVDLNLQEYEARLERIAGEAGAIGAPLEVAVTVSDSAEAELFDLVKRLERIRPEVCRWLVFHVSEGSTTEKWVRIARRILRGYDPSAKVGSGTDAFFTHLNRGRPPVKAIDLACYSINPQVHAFDNASLVETLEAQATTVESAREFLGGLPLAVSPITLKMRVNPDATGPEPAPATAGDLPRPVDVRQMSLFGAGWTLGSIKYLSESGAASLTYYETTGWRGVMETEGGAPMPEQFRSRPGTVYPMYHVFGDVGEFEGGEVLPVRSSATLKVEGMAIRKDGRRRVIVANLTDSPQQVTVQGLTGSVRVKALDETNAEAAMTAPEDFRKEAGEGSPTSAGRVALSFLPYAVVRIDCL